MHAFRNLTLLLVALSGAALMSTAAEGKDGKKPDAGAVKNVSAAEFDKLRAKKDTVVLDVRTPKEYADGHISGAANIDWNSPDFAEKVSKLPKDKTYLVHCAAGVRSSKACALMSSKLNFTDCYNLEGGLKAWEKAGKPVER